MPYNALNLFRSAKLNSLIIPNDLLKSLADTEVVSRPQYKAACAQQREDARKKNHFPALIPSSIKET